MQTLKDDDDAAHSPELRAASQRDAKHSVAHDSTAAAVARKSGKSAASKRPQAAAAPAADEHEEYVAPDTAPPLFKRLESHKRSLSGSGSEHSDQGPAKKKRGRPRKSAPGPSDNEPAQQQEEEKPLSPELAAATGPAKKKQGKGSMAAVATGAQDSRSLAATTLLMCLAFLCGHADKH